MQGHLVFFLIIVFQGLYSQTSTRNPSNELSTDKEVKNPVVNHKVLIVPFDPKLFMCEISKSINKETGMNFEQIRNTFRSGLDFSILVQLKSSYSTVSLLADTSKTKKDLQYIYESIGYKYDLVPEAPDTNKKMLSSILPKKKKEKDEAKPGIKDGQIEVEMNNDKRFMNAKISNPELLGYLNKKYGTDVFLFVNQLDIKNVMDDVYDINSDRFVREITVHYTAFDLSGKELNSGIAVDRFASNINNPKTIVNDHFSVTSKTISDNLIKILTPPAKPEKKAPSEKTKGRY